jgi:hypothetical protein
LDLSLSSCLGSCASPTPSLNLTTVYNLTIALT